MRKLVVDKVTGFENKRPDIPIIIRDFRGVLFYSTLPISKPVERFNLPKGTYFIDSGSFVPLPEPVKYRLVKLPPRERFYPNPTRFKVKFGNNPNKCSIIWGAETILFDHSLKEKPLYVLDFILFHEFGHSRYSQEKNADLFAGNLMKRRGYNPSQIGSAPIDSLSIGADERKMIMIKNLSQYR